MERLKCFECNLFVPNGLNGLRDHLINIHGIKLSEGLGHKGFPCSQNGCEKRFKHFYTLRDHIRKSHQNATAENIDMEVVNESLDENLVNTNCNFNENVVVNENIVNEITISENYQAVENPEKNEPDLNLKDFIIQMIGNYQSNPSVTQSLLNKFIDSSEELIFFLVKKLKSAVTDHCKYKVLPDDFEFEKLLNIFNLESPFCGLRTLDEQIEALEENFNYIKAEEIPLDYRDDVALDKKTCSYLPCLVLETYQYVPVIKVLRMVMSNKDVRDAIMNEKKAPDGILASFIDGECFSSHPFLCYFPMRFGCNFIMMNWRLLTHWALKQVFTN